MSAGASPLLHQRAARVCAGWRKGRWLLFHLLEDERGQQTPGLLITWIAQVVGCKQCWLRALRFSYGCALGPAAVQPVCAAAEVTGLRVPQCRSHL